MSAVADPALRPCAHCRTPMAHLRLTGWQHNAVVVDPCAAGRLVWFDTLESVRLSALGWVALLRTMQQAGAAANEPVAAPATISACPACHVPLRSVHNQMRFGRFRICECPQGHGHLHTHARLLAERGLVRPLLPPEMPRLAHALAGPDRRLAAPPQPDGRVVACNCRGCGSTLDPSRHAACPACAHPVVVPSLLDITPVLDAGAAQPQGPKLPDEVDGRPRPHLRRVLLAPGAARSGGPFGGTIVELIVSLGLLLAGAWLAWTMLMGMFWVGFSRVADRGH